MYRRNPIKLNYNKSKLSNSLFDFTKTIIYVFAVMTIIFTYVAREAKVVGDSMKNTLLENDRVLLTNFNYEPKSGDIVAISTEKLSEQFIIKRVIATEGQTLEIDYDHRKVYVDGILLDEDYLSSITTKAVHEYKFPYEIPKNCLFVMGDNREVSLDSRNAKLGLVSEDEVIGKAQFIFYPFDRVQYLY